MLEVLYSLRTIDSNAILRGNMLVTSHNHKEGMKLHCYVAMLSWLSGSLYLARPSVYKYHVQLAVVTSLIITDMYSYMKPVYSYIHALACNQREYIASRLFSAWAGDPSTPTY